MKKIKSIFSLTLIILAIGFNTKLFANANGKDSFEKNYSINPNGMLVLIGYSSNVEILTWDKNELKVAGEISYGEGSAEDINKLVSAFKNLNAKVGDKTVSINLNHFIKSSVSKGNKNTITLSSGDKTSIKGNQAKTTYKIWIPKSLNLELSQTYGSIKTADIDGNLTLNLYSTAFTIGSYGSTGKFDMKYSKGSIGNGGNTTFTLYSTEIATINQLKDVSIDSKYCKLNIKSVQNAKIESYSDKFLFEQADGISFSAKYSELRINSSLKSFTLDVYSSKIFAKDCGEVKFDAKYSNFNAGNINNLTIPSSYSNKYNVNTVGSLSCTDTKYDTFSIDKLTASANFKKAYSTKVDIAGTASSFRQFSGDFTYGNIYIKLDPAISYKLKYSTTYGVINTTPSTWYSSNIEKDKSGVIKSFEGSTAADTKASIEFTSYSANITID